MQRVGEDRNANVIEGLEDNELSTWGIIRCKDRRTTFKERITTDTQQICRVDYDEYALIEVKSTLLMSIRPYASAFWYCIED